MFLLQNEQFVLDFINSNSNTHNYSPSYFQSKSAILTVAYSYIISSICAIITIYIIYKSPTKLKSVYHRIIVAICWCDFLYSSSSSFTTFPMPAPNEDFWTDLNTYGSPSWRFGNSLACSVQGFSISFGLCSFCGYFIGLNLYYVFSIGLRLSNITIEKYIEPIIHLVTITWALWATVPPLFHHGYNAVDVQPFCAMSQRPNRCIQHHNNNMNATECMIDFFAAFDPGQSDQMFNFTAKLLGVFVTICLTFVCYRVFYYERQIISTLNQHQDGTCNECCTCNDNNVDECCQRTHEEVKYEETKVIIFQSATYVLCVLIVTFAWFIYSSIPPTQTQTTWQQITLLALSSLQGLFCLCFFMVHKVYTLKRLQVSYHQNNKKVYNMSTWSAIKYIIKGGGVENSSLINMDILLPLNAKTYGHNHNSIETKRDSDDSRISSVTNEYGDRLYKKNSQWWWKIYTTK